VADDRVETESLALARRIAEGAPLSARFHKAAIRRLQEHRPVTSEEAAAASDFTRTDDFLNACRSFLAKERPVFRGR
jgi:enoyl-CoA hydratase/carnithine racemase